MKLAKIQILVCLLLSVVCRLAIASPEPIAGHWHADLQIPTGSLSLIFTITQNEDGELSATMESPDQAPGQQIPISEITVAEDELRIMLKALGASIEADWDDEHDHWVGTFSQGMELPIIIERGLPANTPIIEGLDGTWHGVINRNGVDLRLILHISTEERGTRAKVDSPDTMNMNISVSDLTKDGDQVGYTIPVVSGVYKGTLTDPNTMTGTWTVPGQEALTLTYTRSKESSEPVERLRPQVPTEPYGYRSEDVTYKNPLADGIVLAGTLTIPEGKGPFPAAILISGSGPQDRNETVFGHQPFLVLADHLTKQGIAVLRYDDRGTHESTGDYLASNSADFATDANAAFSYLLTRSEIDPDAIGFVGHSEGGLIAPLAITEHALGADTEHPIAFLVMLAGPGTSSQQILQSQNRLIALSQGVSEEEIDKAVEFNAQIIQASITANSTEEAQESIRQLFTDEVMEEMDLSDMQAQTVMTQYSTPWMRYFLTYDPAEYLPRIDIPILALNGELDLQVPAQENLDGLRKLLKAHPDSTIKELKDLNHMFQHAKTGALGEYNDIEETFAPEAMQIISDWINERFGHQQ
ncbi:MAG: alpha/beta hydrolase family protein [Phycisphaerales bacterium]